MKRIFFISASILAASAAFAQTDAYSDNSLYQFNNTSHPKEVRKLGTAPEFPFLRNMTSSRQVYNAIKKHDRDNTPAMTKLNDLLMQIGYANGAKDLQPSDITEAMVPVGTEGNMGSRGYTYAYYRLAGDPSEFKAWKITPNEGSNASALYIFAKCGNAFYPKNMGRTACISVPVTVTPDVQQVSLNNSGSEVTTTDQVYVYYTRKHHKKDDKAYPVAGINDAYPSDPIKVSAMKNMDVIPETYTVSLSAPDNRTVTACTDETLNLTANVNVEKTSTYTGNYPKDDHKVYKKVSKRHYKQIARKMRKAQRKADKVARRTETPVEVKVSNKA